MHLEHAHQPINRIPPWRGDIPRVIHPIARIRQQPRHVRHRRTVRVPVERGLTLKSRGIRQGVRIYDPRLIRGIADCPIPIPTVIAISGE